MTLATDDNRAARLKPMLIGGEWVADGDDAITALLQLELIHHRVEDLLRLDDLELRGEGRHVHANLLFTTAN